MTVRVRNRVLILGGGFGALYTALELERLLPRKSYIEITLVNRENFFLFTPMLHEVAASDLDITHIVNPIRKLLRRAKFFHGEVQAIDLREKRVRVVHGPERHLHEIEYDYLVLAKGEVLPWGSASNRSPREAGSRRPRSRASFARDRVRLFSACAGLHDEFLRHPRTEGEISCDEVARRRDPSSQPAD